MEIQQININEIKEYEKNAKKHDEDQIKNVMQSIKEFGMVQPIVIDQNNIIIIGHCRFRALKRLKWEEVPCVKIENLSEKDINKLRLLDNKLNESEWDFDLLFDQIGTIDWDDFDIDWGLDDFLKEDEKSEIIEDEVPDVENTSISQVGDIYILGKHRLICGDSTDATVIDRLMDGVKADIAFTSPPYNAGTTATETAMGKTTKYNGNDDNRTESEYRDFLNSYLHCALSASEYVFMNVQSIANNKIALIDVLSDNKEIYADTIIWDKQNGQPAMANNVLNSVFEYIHIFSEKANRAIGTIDFRGTIDNIVHLPPQRNNEFSNIHNATFSVEFASWFISRFAKETVLDSFGGTGTTLIACEQLNRRCFMCELSPNYVDVIVKRYIDFTNNKNDVYVIRDGKKIKYKDLKA
jgi:DNA modification methylase